MTPADLRALIEKAESTSPRKDYREWAVAQQRLDHAIRNLAPHFAALWEACELVVDEGTYQMETNGILLPLLQDLSDVAREQGGEGV